MQHFYSTLWCPLCDFQFFVLPQYWAVLLSNPLNIQLCQILNVHRWMENSHSAVIDDWHVSCSPLSAWIGQCLENKVSQRSPVRPEKWHTQSFSLNAKRKVVNADTLIVQHIGPSVEMLFLFLWELLLSCALCYWPQRDATPCCWCVCLSVNACAQMFLYLLCVYLCVCLCSFPWEWPCI